MIWLRRGSKMVRARNFPRARAAACAAWLSLAQLADGARAASAPLASAGSSSPSLASTLRAVSRPPEFAASTTAAAHRIALPAGPPLELRLSPLEGTLELRTKRGDLLRARLPLLSTPCHPVDPASDEVRLQCDTGRLDASLVEVNGRRYLDLRELRGLPTNEGDEGPPRVDYAPELFGLGGACPGDTDAARGECAYEAGKDAKAEAALTLALKDERTRRFAALRLGDLFMRRRDPDRALVSYLQVGDQGLWGRLASERLCELTGSCFADTLMAWFDPVGLPPPLAAELALREIRFLALLGRWGESMEMLANLLDAEPGSCIGDNKLLCRHVVLAALGSPACLREAALSAYLRLPGFLSGPLAPEMARAAAEDAGELGAPEYGASLLSATVRLAARGDLLSHAQQAIALYRAADDPYRAHVMWSWASTRLSQNELRALPPDLIAQAGAPAPLSLASTAGADLESDVTSSALAIARSTLLRSRAVTPPAPPPRKRR